MRRVEVHRARGEHASLWYWQDEVGFWKTSRNYVFMGLARHSPSLAAKNWLYRRMGAKVDKHACVGLEVTFDIFFPELITVEEDATIGFATTILCHEFLRDEWRTGEVKIRRGATIGANCTILPGVEIGPGAMVSAMSLVNRDVPAGEFWGGIPARPIDRTPKGEATPT
ncbi:MAG: acyltransferase [Thermoplasmatota archaeon]